MMELTDKQKQAVEQVSHALKSNFLLFPNLQPLPQVWKSDSNIAIVCSFCQGEGYSHWLQYMYARVALGPFWQISVPQRVEFSVKQ